MGEDVESQLIEKLKEIDKHWEAVELRHSIEWLALQFMGDLGHTKLKEEFYKLKARIGA